MHSSSMVRKYSFKISLLVVGRKVDRVGPGPPAAVGIDFRPGTVGDVEVVVKTEVRPVRTTTPGGPYTGTHSFYKGRSTLLFMIPNRKPTSPGPGVVQGGIDRGVPLRERTDTSTTPRADALRGGPFQRPVLSCGLPRAD